ncbi:MAG: C1 family peptidase [Nibricoccus sp.]
MKILIKAIIAAMLSMTACPVWAWNLDLNAAEPDCNVYAQDQFVVAIMSGNADCMVSIVDTGSGELVAGGYFMYQPSGGYFFIPITHPAPGVKINGGTIVGGMEMGFSGLPEGRQYSMSIFCPDLDQEYATGGGCLDYGGCQFYSNSSSNYCQVVSYIGELLYKRLNLSRYFPSPKDQGNWQASCVPWAVTVARTYQLAKKRGLTNVNDPSVQLSPAYIYNQFCPNGGLMNIQDALVVLRDQGCATLSEMPYNVTADPSRNPNPQPTDAQRASATNNRVPGFSWYYTNNNVEQTKLALEDGNPVVIGINVSVPSGVDWHWVWHGGTWYNPIGFYSYDPYVTYTTIGHAVCLIGYDDSCSSFICIDSLTIDYKLHGIDFSGWPVEGIKDDVHACYRYIRYTEPIDWTCVMTQEP